MGREKPIDIGPLRHGSRKAKGPSLYGIAFAALAALCIAAALFLFASGQGAQQQGEPGKITIYLRGPPTVMENSTVRITALSSCGAFSTFLDGAKQQQGVQEAEVAISPPPGSHVFEARNGNCSDSVGFSVVAPECSDGQVRQCISDGCAGNETCFGGNWGGCALPWKICSPGQEIGCSLDGCHFGYSVCNRCGSGFGPCMPENGTNASAGCTGNSCG